MEPTDADRFEALYRAHYAAIVRYAARRAGGYGVEEVVADTFATAWRRLDDVPADALPWLYVVARHHLSDQHRGERSDRAKAANAASAGTFEARDPADSVAERDVVLQAFRSLSEPHREALRLVAWEGLSHQQAAQVCGISRVAYSMRLARARRGLTRALSGLESPPSASAATARPQESQP